MINKKIELELNAGTIGGTIAVIVALLGGLRWISNAEISHAETKKLDVIVDELHQQQKLERELWGESYRQRIHEVLTNAEEE